MYAIPAGWWPTDAGTFRLRVKLGSTRSVDAVGTSHSRYDTILGHTDVWWLESSADAYRDELNVLYTHFDDRRVFSDRELFHFDDRADFEREIATFTAGFRAVTGHEEAHKAAVIIDLMVPNGLGTRETKATRSARRAEGRVRREQARAREREIQETAVSRREDTERDKVRKRAMREAAIAEREQARRERVRERETRETAVSRHEREKQGDDATITAWASEHLQQRDGAWVLLDTVVTRINKETGLLLGKKTVSLRVKSLFPRAFRQTRSIEGVRYSGVFWGVSDVRPTE